MKNSTASKPSSDTDQWKPDLYDGKHSFVWKLGASVIELLAPKFGERIIDVGCGTGQLTAQIAESRATVVGLDNSPAMIDEARRLYPQIEFMLADAHDFEIDQPFDGVFSNAALHWIKDPDKVLACISRALKQNGRMVVNRRSWNVVSSTAIETVTQSFLGETVPHPWYFPSIAEFASILERHRLEVTQAAMIDRPTLSPMMLLPSQMSITKPFEQPQRHLTQNRNPWRNDCNGSTITTSGTRYSSQ
ncbi:MAG: class I SAM-dependent methyltransferase [Planctomycetaceae bacterium]